MSGGLNREIGGPPVFPALQDEVLAQMSHGIWRKQADGPDVWRRSVYVYRKRGLPFPMFESFDLPDQNISCGARNVSTVPTQALMLFNDEFVIQQAELFAQRVQEAEPDDAEPPDRTGLSPGARTRSRRARTRISPSNICRRHNLAGFTHVLLNLNEFVYLR